MRFEKRKYINKKQKISMTLILDYLILCGFMFGFVTALYIGLKTIKLI